MPLKMIFYRGDLGQCWASRGHRPLAELAKNYGDDYHIEISGILDRRKINDYNLAIFQRQYNQDVFSGMELMKKLNTKVIYEVDDDLFNVPKWSSAYKTYGKKTIQDNVKAFLENVDAVFTTTNYLADIFEQYCEHVFVLPNSIDFEILHDPPNNSKKHVVLWQGSKTHDKDVAIMKKTFERLAEDNDVLIKLWSMDLGLPNSYTVPYVGLDAFYSMFAQMDATVGIAPLAFVPFNKGKSNLKILEYWAHKVPVIASDFGPYADTIQHEENGLLVRNNNEWYDAIRYLLDSPNIRYNFAAEGYDYVKTHYDISKNYILWKDAIDTVMNL